MTWRGIGLTTLNQHLLLFTRLLSCLFPADKNVDVLTRVNVPPEDTKTFSSSTTATFSTDAALKETALCASSPASPENTINLLRRRHSGFMLSCCATFPHPLFLEVLRCPMCLGFNIWADRSECPSHHQGSPNPTSIVKLWRLSGDKMDFSWTASTRIPNPSNSDQSTGILMLTSSLLLSSAACCSFILRVSVRQVSDSQRVDPLGSWMDFVKRPVPAKCRKRKRPLVKYSRVYVKMNQNKK